MLENRVVWLAIIMCVIFCSGPTIFAAPSIPGANWITGYPSLHSFNFRLNLAPHKDCVFTASPIATLGVSKSFLIVTRSSGTTMPTSQIGKARFPSTSCKDVRKVAEKSLVTYFTTNAANPGILSPAGLEKLSAQSWRIETGPATGCRLPNTLASNCFAAAGKNITGDAAFVHIRLFVKKGPTFFSRSEMQFACEKTADAHTLHTDSGKNAAFIVYEDQHSNYHNKHGAFSNFTLNYTETTGELTISNGRGKSPRMSARRNFINGGVGGDAYIPPDLDSFNSTSPGRLR